MCIYRTTYVNLHGIYKLFIYSRQFWKNSPSFQTCLIFFHKTKRFKDFYTALFSIQTCRNSFGYEPCKSQQHAKQIMIWVRMRFKGIFKAVVSLLFTIKMVIMLHFLLFRSQANIFNWQFFLIQVTCELTVLLLERSVAQACSFLSSKYMILSWNHA